ncbi:MAG: PglZ domain-containing protein, partial [Candidatus Dormibacteraceae bacterium]
YLRDIARDLVPLADLSRASPEPIRGFDLLHRLSQLVPACEEASARARSCTSAEDVLRVYTESAGKVDREHWRLIADCRKEADVEDLLLVANRAYGEYLETLNETFFENLRERTEWKLSDICPVSEVAADVWNARGPRAVIIVDALRYDCAIEIRDKLRLPESSLTPALSCIPTRTWVGMTALLPLGGEQLRYEVSPGEGRLRLVSTNANFGDRQARLNFLRDRVGATCLEIEDMENESRAPKPLPEVLCVFGHETIDSLGHDKASDLMRHLDAEVDRLGLLIGKLHRWGYPEVHLLTDHGFITTSSEVEPTVVAIASDRTLVTKSRYALVEEGALINAKTFPFPFDPRIHVAVPPGMAFFKPEKTFSHGGIALQEVVIPHLVSRHESIATRVQIQVIPAAYEVKTYSVKVVLDPVLPDNPDLFTKAVGRTVEVDLVRESQSILAHPVKKEIKPEAGQKVTVVLMLSDRLAFMEGEVLDLIVRDVETREVLSPRGLRLTVARSLTP